MYSLPTEAQCEYAASAGTTTPFSFGSCLPTAQANYNGNYPMPGCSKGQYIEKTVTVASFSPNAWGLYDMHGNVWEWCQDWYGDYPSRAVKDPAGAKTGSGRVLRAGRLLGQLRQELPFGRLRQGAGRPTASRPSAFAWPGFPVFSEKSMQPDASRSDQWSWPSASASALDLSTEAMSRNSAGQAGGKRWIVRQFFL